MSAIVTARAAIVPNGLPESITGHRADYWTWVEDHADSATRGVLLTLRDHWRECNERYFGRLMVEPYITLTEPSAPQVFGQCCSVSSWGSRLEIRIRPSLLDGTHPKMSDAPSHAAGRLQFVKDVLLHEMVHQHIFEHQPGVNESSYHGHGPVFTEHCNRISVQLGLPEVVVRNRGGEKKPKAPQWPHCVAPSSRYRGAYNPGRGVTAKTVAIPSDYCPVVITPVVLGNDGAVLEVDFEPELSDVNDKAVRLRVGVDTAAQLAGLINDFFTETGGEE